MPTILRKDGYRFFFYPHDLINEPPHIHVRKGSNEAKFWLGPVRLVKNIGYREHELRRVEKLVQEYHDFLITRWHEEIQNL